MTTFEYKGFSAEGRPRSGLIEAEGLKDARKRLAERGVVCERVREAGGGVEGTAGGARRQRFPAEARTMFYRELAALLGSGVALVPALDVILQAPELDAARGPLAAARDRVREGQALSTALPAAAPAVSPFEQAVMEAGERTGGMGDALTRLAGFLEEESRLREKLVGALLYPCVVIALAIVLGGLVLTFMLPMMTGMLQEANLELPWVTRVMLGGGRALGTVLLAMALGGAVAVMGLRRRLKTDEGLRIRLDRKVYALPVVGGGWRNLASLRFVRVLGLLLERGVGLMESVPLAGKASGSAWLAECARRETGALGQGKPLVEVVRGITPLHPSLAAWVQAGEAGGNLTGLLENAAQRFQQNWERLTTRGMMWLETGLTVLIGLFVTLIALAVLLPILQMNKGMLS